MPKKENSYEIFDSFCLRTPLFPFSKYKKLLSNSHLTSEDFKEILKDTLFREAIYLASPELFSEIEKWEKGSITDLVKIEKIHFSILKYFTRISTRCTPFGLFASCTSGEFDSETNISLQQKNNYKRFTRFDTTFLTQLFQELLKNTVIKEHVLFYPNNGLYQIGDHYRYVEYSIEKKRRNYSLEGLGHSEYIEKVLKLATVGKTMNQLGSILIDDEINQEEAQGFIAALIENQVLVSELEITVTGKDYFENLIYKIHQIPKITEIAHQLKLLQKQLKELDTKIGNTIAIYKEIITTAKVLVPELDAKYLLQTDCFSTSTANTFDKNLKRQLKSAFVLFNKMSLPSANGNIEDFKRNFLKRFEQSEVPLNLLLDTETGIGYGSKKEDANDLIDDLPLFGTKKRYERIIWTDVDTILQEKLINVLKNGQQTITLTKEDFKELPTNVNDLPDTFSSILEIYKTKEKQQIFIRGISGASATYLLGRFAHGEEKLLASVKEIVSIEETINNNKILAEIVHLPEARTGNILQRPTFRNYEIPYLGKSNVATEHQISVEDILVSIKNDTIVLRSKKLNKEILPRLGNAHNYSGNPLPIYQFLCELQNQNKRSSIGFSWNSIFDNHSFLPRVEFENFIFSKARWKILVKDFKEICKKENLLSTIKKWQKENLIPQYVELVEGDNKLLINLNNKTSIKMLLNTIKNRKQFILEEFLFSDDNIVKDNNNNSFCNQFVVSYYNDERLKNVGNG